MNLNFSSKEQELSESEQFHLSYFLLFKLITLPCCTSNRRQVFNDLRIYTRTLHTPWGFLQYTSLRLQELMVTCKKMIYFIQCTRITLVWSQTPFFFFLLFYRQITLALVGNKQIVYSHIAREKERGLHLFAISLGVQKHPMGFTCLSTDFPFSGVLYWCNGSRNHYTWISLQLPNMRAH